MSCMFYAEELKKNFPMQSILPLISLKFNFDPFYGVFLLQLFKVDKQLRVGGATTFYPLNEAWQKKYFKWSLNEYQHYFTLWGSLPGKSNPAFCSTETVNEFGYINTRKLPLNIRILSLQGWIESGGILSRPLLLLQPSINTQDPSVVTRDRDHLLLILQAHSAAA